MPTEIRIVTGKKDLEQFIRLPMQLHAKRENFVPPLLHDERRFYDKRFNNALNFSETILALAYENNICSGRIMGIIPLEHNKLQNEKTARFFNLDCVNDFNVCKALIDFVEQWAFEKGMNQIIGPFGFSDKDPQGFQIEGFEFLPVIATPVNPAYMPSLIELCSYKKMLDCLSYKMMIPDEVPEYYNRIYQRVMNRSNLKLIEFKRRSELRPFIIPVFELINEAYRDIFGFMAMHKAEMDYMANQYLPVLDPDYVKCIVNEHNDLIAFVIAMPHMSEGLKEANGKLFPFGFIHILIAMRKTRQLNLLLGAVANKYQGLGLTTALGIKLFESAKKNRMEFIDSHLILETNLRMRAELERLGALIYKRYRIYSKGLLLTSAIFINSQKNLWRSL